MSLTEQQKHQLNRLLDYRNDIENALFQIERILKEYFPSEFDTAYQHWIPQISTAICENEKWLSRGQYSMQQTLDRLFDKSKDDSTGLSRYI